MKLVLSAQILALLILAMVSFPQWKTLLSAEPRVWFCWLR